MEEEKLIEKISQVVRSALAYAEFASLVKRMREAQVNKEIVEANVRYQHEEGIKITKEDHELYASVTTKAVFLEDEVDEYLEKMED